MRPAITGGGKERAGRKKNGQRARLWPHHKTNGPFGASTNSARLSRVSDAGAGITAKATTQLGDTGNPPSEREKKRERRKGQKKAESHKTKPHYVKVRSTVKASEVSVSQKVFTDRVACLL